MPNRVRILEWNDGPITEKVRQAIMRGVVKGTEEVRNEMVRLIQSGPKTGRVYTRRGVSHQASAPGEPPATDTGRLVNSITTEYDAAKLTGTVSANTEYAEFLEYGTQTMAERPFMRPALANKQEKIIEDMKKEVAAALP